MSHRSSAYQEIFDRTVRLLRELMEIPDEYEVLLLQGGATGQFAAVPMNLLKTGADYVDSGNFAHGAFVEAQKYGNARVIASSREESYARVPDVDAGAIDPDADYVYITTNNTIYGTRYVELPETGGVPLVADMSSNILSEPYDVTRFGAIYAGAQKNIGPAGATLVIVRRDLLGGAKTLLLGNLIKNELMQARNWPMGATLSIAMLLFTFAFILIYKKVTGAKNLGGIR